MLACNKQHYLSSFYGLVPGGVTPEDNPLSYPVICLARAHQTPLVTCGSLTAYLVPLGKPFISILGGNTKDTKLFLSFLKVLVLCMYEG
jgi:hypothetical protein